MIYEVIDGPYPCESSATEMGTCLYVKGWFDEKRQDKELWFKIPEMAEFVKGSILSEFSPLTLGEHVDLFNEKEEKELNLDDLN